MQALHKYTVYCTCS